MYLFALTEIIDGQAVSGTAVDGADSTALCVKVLDQTRDHLVLGLCMTEATESSKAPAVGALLRVDSDLESKHKLLEKML